MIRMPDCSRVPRQRPRKLLNMTATLFSDSYMMSNYTFFQCVSFDSNIIGREVIVKIVEEKGSASTIGSEKCAKTVAELRYANIA